MKLAILLTCFNRVEVTKQCLDALEKYRELYDIFLVDDGSTDGTYELVKTKYPYIKLIKGSGNLFWSRGMYLAWETAANFFNYDFYIWLNNDVFLYDFWLDELISCYQKANGAALVVGLIENKERTEIIYGGYGSDRQRILVNGKMNPIHFMNGNVVLVSKEVHNALGNLDPRYHHDLGDVDYGLRAHQKGIEVLSTTKAVGTGTINTINRERLKDSTLKKRFQRLNSPLGSPPMINYYFRKKHYGVLNALLYFGFQYMLNILPDKVLKIVFKKYLR